MSLPCDAGMTMTTKELLALVGRWRERGEREREDTGYTGDTAHDDCADELEAALSVAQGQGFVMVPRENIEALIRDLESPVGCYTGAIAKKLRYLLAAAPAQPDGVG